MIAQPHSHPIDVLRMPRLVQPARPTAKPVIAAAAPRKASGLSVADIADVSMTATVKAGLTAGPKVCRKLYR